MVACALDATAPTSGSRGPEHVERAVHLEREPAADDHAPVRSPDRTSRPAHQRNPHGGEVFGIDALRQRPQAGRVVVVRLVDAAAERRGRDDGGGLDFGIGEHAFLDLVPIRTRARRPACRSGRAASTAPRRARNRSPRSTSIARCTLRIIMPATINSRQLPATCDDHHDAAHQRAIERARHVLAAVLDRIDQMLLRDLPRRQQSDDDERRAAPSATATHHRPPLDAEIQVRRKAAKRRDQRRRGPREAEAAERAHRDQRHRFDDELTNDSRSPRAERHAHAELAHAPGGARHHQVAKIGRRHDEDQRGQRADQRDDGKDCLPLAVPHEVVAGEQRLEPLILLDFGRARRPLPAWSTAALRAPRRRTRPAPGARTCRRPRRSTIATACSADRSIRAA